MNMNILDLQKGGLVASLFTPPAGPPSPINRQSGSLVESGHLNFIYGPKVAKCHVGGATVIQMLRFLFTSIIYT